MTRGEGEGDNGGKNKKGHQGTCIKDPCTKTTGGREDVGGGVGRTEESSGGIMGTTVIEQ